VNFSWGYTSEIFSHIREGTPSNRVLHTIPIGILLSTREVAYLENSLQGLILKAIYINPISYERLCKLQVMREDR